MLIEIAVIAIILVIGITQLIIPVFRNTPLFPIFQRSDPLDRKLLELRRAKEIAEKEAEIAHLEEQVAHIKQQCTCGAHESYNPFRTPPAPQTSQYDSETKTRNASDK